MLRPHKLKKESGTILELGRQMQEKFGWNKIEYEFCLI